MEIQKLIKRGNIRQEPVESIIIDPNVNVSDITAGQSGAKGHKALMKNAIRLMGSKMSDIVFSYKKSLEFPLYLIRHIKTSSDLFWLIIIHQTGCLQRDCWAT